MQIHGCENVECRISDFYIFIYLTEEVDFCSVTLIPFRGNWFRVLFYNGGILNYLVQHFFLAFVKDDNELFEVVYTYLQIRSCLCGCWCLGL